MFYSELHKLYMYRAENTTLSIKLSDMVTQWKNGNISASWKSFAAALGKTTGYGPTTAAKFLNAAKLPGNELTLHVLHSVQYPKLDKHQPESASKPTLRFLCNLRQMYVQLSEHVCLH